jgi:hypothetical protein
MDLANLTALKLAVHANLGNTRLGKMGCINEDRIENAIASKSAGVIETVSRDFHPYLWDTGHRNLGDRM